MTLINNRVRAMRYSTTMVSLLLVLIAIVALMTQGLNWGLDFTGGMVTEVIIDPSLSYQSLSAHLNQQIDASFAITKAAEEGRWLIRYAMPNNDMVAPNLAQLLGQISHQVDIISHSVVGAQVGDELVEAGTMALLVSVLSILAYLCLRFEWRLATGALVALAHDVVLVLGFFALTGMEFNLTVFSAILAILGYSLNDSIIIADRVRELLIAKPTWTTADINDYAVRGTFSRTMVTSGTTLITVSALWWMGGEPLLGFSTAMFIGVFCGTWSSISISTVLAEQLKLTAMHYQPTPVDDNP
ncbi:protein translocase subunit SecF [Vibrio sp. SM6]|uniref:Protein translocase subunit SecF n=1 Tax=Vibrio agarilyticus TaxID=2726741 RepID=A0A7X8TNQ9_9VIBR|nr:protein translocase subunit SecF [Vibrio agarilyticus]NLS12125.1 protein translocase subunit SecF [Vibrio agarilyticus]